MRGDTLRSVAASPLADVESAFAMTAHKSQGSGFAHVLMLLPDADVPALTRERVCTGVTRARAAFTRVCKDRAPLTRASNRLTPRVSGLAAMRAGATGSSRLP